MSKIPSYPKVWSLGHPALAGLFEGPVVVQEKVDGSQFSFGVFDGELHMRSKGAEVFAETADKLFRPAVETAQALKPLLLSGFVYRAEAVTRPKHNTIQYSRVPAGSIVLFDVEAAPDTFLSEEGVCIEASRLEVEHVPYMRVDMQSMADLDRALEQESFLGGALIEGVVAKNYSRFGPDGKILAGKFVSEAFKETHKKAWRVDNPTRADILEELIDTFRSPARWAKAVQHLREAGQLEGTPRDIGKLIAEAKRDLVEECTAEIQQILWRHFADKVVRGATAGIADWYKRELAEQQFEPAV